MVSTTDTRVLLTRPQKASERFAALLGDPSAITISPVMRIVPLDFALDLRGAPALVLTSQNAVEALAGRDLPALECYCVGEKTARAAADLGLKVRATGSCVSHLAKLIVAAPPAGRLMHIRGEHVAGDLEGALGDVGLTVEPVTAYRQSAVALSREAVLLLKSSKKVIIPIFSPRSGRLLVEQFTPDMTAPRVGICLSRSIADGLDSSRFDEVMVCDETNATSLRDCVASCLI